MITENQLTNFYEAVSQPQSDFAIEHLINGAQFTSERRLRQAIIELNHAESALTEAQFTCRELKLDIKESSEVIAAATQGIEREREEIKLERAQFRLSNQERLIRGRSRELLVHKRCVEKYVAEMGIPSDISVGELKCIMDNAEGDHYLLKLAMDAAAQVVGKQGGPSQGILLALQQLPEEYLSKLTTLLGPMVNGMGGSRTIAELKLPEAVKLLVENAEASAKSTSIHMATHIETARAR